MKKLVPAVALTSASLLPALALACPAARQANCCAGSHLGEYVSTFGVGLLFGVGSIAVESMLRKKKK